MKQGPTAGRGILLLALLGEELIFSSLLSINFDPHSRFVGKKHHPEEGRPDLKLLEKKGEKGEHLPATLGYSRSGPLRVRAFMHRLAHALSFKLTYMHTTKRVIYAFHFSIWSVYRITFALYWIACFIALTPINHSMIIPHLSSLHFLQRRPLL